MSARLASNLLTGDRTFGQEVFVRDRLAGQTRIVSVNDAGQHSNGISMLPSISADGQHVAFTSAASNLVPGDTNSDSDVFVRD